MKLKIAPVIAVLLLTVSIAVAGCDSNTENTPTASPTVHSTAQVSSQNDPLITAMINAYNKSEGGAQYITWVKLGAEPGLLGSVLFGNDYNIVIEITRYNTVAKATEYYKSSVTNQTKLQERAESPVAWGLDYYTAAAGHAPTVKSVTTSYVGGTWNQTQTVIQYDDTVILYAVDANPNGSS